MNKTVRQWRLNEPACVYVRGGERLMASFATKCTICAQIRWELALSHSRKIYLWCIIPQNVMKLAAPAWGAAIFLFHPEVRLLGKTENISYFSIAKSKLLI